jgi:hypothetical protein
MRGISVAMILPHVLGCGFKAGRIVVQQSDRGVTFRTEQATDFARCVAMIDVKYAGPAARIICAADGTAALLCIEHFCVRFDRYAVSVTKIVCSILVWCSSLSIDSIATLCTATMASVCGVLLQVESIQWLVIKTSIATLCHQITRTFQRRHQS